MMTTIPKWKDAFVAKHVHICALAVDNYTSQLTPLENELVAKSVAIRQNTYSTGRACAKQALSEIGIAANAYSEGLLRNDDGGVHWPSNFTGSITHTNDWAMAAVIALGHGYDAIGIDIEKIDRVEKNLLKVIATDQESAFLESQEQLRWGRVALFSIKESVYKCLRQTFGNFIRFKDVQINHLDRPLATNMNDPETPLFFQPSVQLVLPALAACCDENRIEIRLAVLDTHVVSFVGYKTASK